MSSEINVQNVWEVLYRRQANSLMCSKEEELIGLRDVHEIHVNLYNSRVYHRRWVDAEPLMIIGRSWEGIFFHLFFILSLCPYIPSIATSQAIFGIFACVRRQLKAHS